ncbi:g13549 [Coccomyxa viridis]|uniref:G13549 protein n=1 Tax=Coccomyxa viridis TaxID=1274662 RepID=A0ABP1GDX3_9CHLO
MASKGAVNLTHRLTSESTITTAAREVKNLWPFIVGLGATGYIMLQIGLSCTKEDIENSKFANPNKHH